MVIIDIGPRLKAARTRLRVPPADFAKLCGISRATQFKYEAGERVPDARYLAAAHAAGVDVLYVITGNKAADDDHFVAIQAHPTMASADGEHAEIDGLCISRKWLSQRSLEPAHLRSVDVIGESMKPRLNEGDKVLVDTSDTGPRSGRAYVLLQGNELLVKYCQLLPEGALRVSSENPKFPTYDVDLSKADGVSIVGRVRASTSEW